MSEEIPLIKLPTETTKGIKNLVRKLVIFSHPKTGKTTALAHLPKSLLIDTEDRSDGISAVKINIKKQALLDKVHPLKVLESIAVEITKHIQKEGKSPYDFIVIDSVTAIEDLCVSLATVMYKKTIMGKDFKGNNVVLQTPSGAGYGYLREAFFNTIRQFDRLANIAIIYTGHIKDGSINKEGKEVSLRDVALTGKIKTLLAADVDAIGFLLRDPKTQANILSFKKTENDLISGATAAHLADKEIILSEKVEDEIITHWDQIFLQLNSK
jgi:hypothetical protein